MNIYIAVKSKTLGCFFVPKRRSDYEFSTQNPLARTKTTRKEDSNAGAELRKSRVAVGQGDRSYGKCAEIGCKSLSFGTEKQAPRRSIKVNNW